MGNGQNIIDKILADAKAEAETILKAAKAEADEAMSIGRAKADKEEAYLTSIAEEEAKKVASKQISSAQMEAKKMILSQKQEVIADVIKQAKNKLLSLNETEYKVILIAMLGKAEIEEGSEVILSKKDKETYEEEFTSMGYKISDETREIEGGFVIKNGEIEYNYSFESIISVQKEDVEQLTAQILF